MQDKEMNKNTQAQEMSSEAAAVKRPAMAVKDLSFSYGKNKVIRGTTLEIQEGKITTIMGANGCGKTTLFSLMTKNLQPRKGSVSIGGKKLHRLSLSEFARKVAIVNQYNTAADDITVERLVAFGRTPHMKMMAGKSEEDGKYIDWALDVTGLSQHRLKEVGKLSGGQRQRVWIAMALAQNTKILFLDEPTTHLDIRYQVEILKLIKKLNRELGMTIIMVLHDINQAIHYSDVVIGLKDGKVLLAGKPDEVITSEGIAVLYDIELEVVNVEGRKFLLTV